MDNTVIITPSQDDVDQTRGYRIGRWNHPVAQHVGGYDNYECLECQFSTLYLEKIRKHVDEGVHDWAYPSEKKPVVDNSGEPTY